MGAESARSFGDRRSAHGGGFTLIEMLVVIGVIVLVASLLLVAVNKVYRQGARTKVAADLQAIASALDAYKADFGSYPPVDGTNLGPAVLTKALIGPSPKTFIAVSATAPLNLGQFFQLPPQPPYISLIDGNTTAPPANPVATDNWAIFSPFDGADGPGPEYKQAGFRVGPKTIDDNDDGTPDRPGGKIYGPYLAPDRFIKQVDGGIMVDSNGKPILYFPANPSKPNIAAAGGYVAMAGTALFDLRDNVRFFMRSGESTTLNAERRMAVMFGDYGCDGALNTQFISGNESEGADGAAYVLWSAGDDGLFGPNVPTSGNPQRGEIFISPTSLDQWRHNLNSAKACDDVVSFK